MNQPIAEPATTLSFPESEAPVPGAWKEIAPGVFWVRMPLPFALDHINLWVLRDENGWTLIDTGLNTEISRAAWEQIFTEGLAGKPVRRLVITHYHPDHFGLAGWLIERFGVELWMTEGEYLTALAYFTPLPMFTNNSAVDFFMRHGLDPAHEQSVRNRKHAYPKAIVTPPPQFHRMIEGDQLTIDGRSWRVIIGTGHAPEHAALYCEEIGVLISGDMVLPKISTNVSVWPTEPEGDPLSLFLGSVDRYAALPEDTLVLPSHGLPFYGLQIRANALHRHHDARLSDLLAACDRPVSAWEVAPVLFRRQLDTHQIFFAMGEAIAHLNYLLYKGRVMREEDEDRVLRFCRV